MRLHLLALLQGEMRKYWLVAGWQRKHYPRLQFTAFFRASKEKTRVGPTKRMASASVTGQIRRATTSRWEIRPNPAVSWMP